MKSAVSRSDGPVLCEMIREHVALVTLNRPEARNAVNDAVATALHETVNALEREDQVWAVVLTGARNGTFCAGADLKEVSAGRGGALLARSGGFAGFVNADRVKPWIAAVNGHALAGGMEIVLACDFAIAGDNVDFGLPEVKRGLIALGGGVHRLPHRIPRAHALELIATGDRLSAERADKLGLVNRLVSAEDVLPVAVEFAEKICESAPVAVRESLRLARLAYDISEEESIRRGMEARDRLTQTEDYREGPRAFVERRAPVWKGR